MVDSPPTASPRSPVLTVGPIKLPAAEYGLYGAFVPCIAYALLGSSRQLAVGPVAVTSIMLANGLSKIFPGQEDQVGGDQRMLPRTRRLHCQRCGCQCRLAYLLGGAPADVWPLRRVAARGCGHGPGLPWRC